MNNNLFLKLKARIVFTLLLGIICSVSVAQNAQTATGIILDESNMPLIGANITEFGTNNTTSSNRKGEFRLQLRTASQIEVSYVGKRTQLLQVLDNRPVRIVLKDDSIALERIVVIGYGTQREKDITGSISSIKASDFENTPIEDVNQAIQGQVAGVNIMNTSGTPGGGLDIQIRGISSIGASNTPLYVVDGNILEVSMNPESNPIAFINPADIESIDILKDASAAAIYGSRGSNGVVIITTKSGAVGKTKINYNVKAGVQEIFNPIEVLSARDFAKLAIESRNNDWVDRGNGANSPLDADFLRPEATKVAYFLDFLNNGEKGTDWQDEVFQLGVFQNHELSASGGNKSIGYYISGGYLENQGTMPNTGFKRYSMRSNINVNLTNRLRVKMNFSPSYTNQDYLPEKGRFHEAFGGIVQSAILMNPMIGIYDSESYNGYTTMINAQNSMQNMENPVAKLNLLKDWRRNLALMANASAIYDLSKAFTFTITGGSVIRSMRRDYINPSSIGGYAIKAPKENTVGSRQNIRYNIQGSAQLSYGKKIGKHRISAVAVHEKQMDQYNLLSATANATWTDALIVVDNNLENILREGSSDISEWALSSWIARASYSFDNRYSVMASIRRDGSSKFADRWGTFPAAAVAWRLSNEKFMKDFHWISDMKMRASYGVTGNNSIGNYSYMSFMGGSSYVLGTGGEGIVSGISLDSYGNSSLTWEQTEQTDFGIDLSLFRNRVAFTVDYYDKRTKDLLLNVQLPSNMGFANLMTNIGKVQNKGWEFSVDTRNVIGIFNWNSGFNISFNKQKVLALGPEGDPLWGNSIYLEHTHITEVGQPMGLFYGLNIIGIYQDQKQVDELPGISAGAARSRPGDWIFENVDDSDNEITLDDRTVIGSPHPDFVFGFKNSFTYKGFSLDVMMRGAYGADIINLNFGTTPYSLNTNGRVGLKNRWQSEEEPGDGKTPRLALATRGVLGSGTFNSDYVEDGSFLNIQNVTFGYDLPKRMTHRMNIEKLKFQLSVNNLFMFTQYKGWNPEGGMYTDVTLSPGLDWGRYPLSRVYTLGINLTF